MRPKKNGILNRHYEVHAGQRHYEEISFLRGFSILTIVLMHLIQGYLTSCSEFVRTASSIGGAGSFCDLIPAEIFRNLSVILMNPCCL